MDPILFALKLSMPGGAIALLASAAFSYFLGCTNGSVIVSKYILKDDIRAYGSGNAGLTNFYRTFGGGLTAVVILMDVVKMILSVWLSLALVHTLMGSGALVTAFAKYWAGAWCIIGHMFPCMFGFKGGKGVLSGGALAIMIDWRVALVVWGGFIVLAVLTRYVSLGSCWAGFTFPIATAFVYRNVILVLLAIVSGGLLLWKHRSNMGRLLRGTESKFAFRHKQKK